MDSEVNEGVTHGRQRGPVIYEIIPGDAPSTLTIRPPSLVNSDRKQSDIDLPRLSLRPPAFCISLSLILRFGGGFQFSSERVCIACTLQQWRLSSAQTVLCSRSVHLDPAGRDCSRPYFAAVLFLFSSLLQFQLPSSFTWTVVKIPSWSCLQLCPHLIFHLVVRMILLKLKNLNKLRYSKIS